ncbi:ParE family toxin-like protein [Nitratireductor sp. CH_MIT9313-5]|uniref:ParE family toxin-like protein n=1 Tax=Nitratireductor sp. CH_MIT9313-5 TaxID=3107764 RepID=UPI003FA57884
MKHVGSARFWKCYAQLPEKLRGQADQAFELLKQDERHPSLHFKRVGKFWSVRVTRDYRALGVRKPDSMIWVWIGNHADYDRLVNRS